MSQPPGDGRDIRHFILVERIEYRCLLLVEERDRPQRRVRVGGKSLNCVRHRLSEVGDECIAVPSIIELNGYVADSAYTFAVGEISPEMQRLMKVTKEALFIGLDKCKAGNRVGDISHAVQMHCEKNGYSVVRELCGHGVGFKMHESPNVPNFGTKGTGPLLKEGMVIAVEPMVCMGSKNVKFSKEDGWTCRTRDGKAAAHYEHTVAITANGPDILTTFDFIENK